MKNSWDADAGSANDNGNGYTDVYVDYLKSSTCSIPLCFRRGTDRAGAFRGSSSWGRVGICP